MLLVNQIIQEADKENKKGRIYPAEVLRLTFEHIPKEQALFGELGGPAALEDKSLSDAERQMRCLIVSADNVSHKVSNFKFEDNVLTGDIETLANEKGVILDRLITENKVQFAMRGFVKFKSGTKIVDQCQIISIDAVSERA
jgi:hypothetical protein